MLRSLALRQENRSEDGFRWRGVEVSRLEGLSDAVIGFAITLLIVSLDVPQTFDDLLLSIRGFAAFAVSFALLMVIWNEHNNFFRRYGLHDARITVLNSLLLFLILFYVYPLRFLFAVSVNPLLGLDMAVVTPEGAVTPPMRNEQVPQLFLLYAVGWTAVFLLFALFYQHALSQRERLELTPREVFLTQSAMLENFFASGVGVLSMILAVTLPLHAINFAGWVFLLLFPISWAFKRHNRRKSVTPPEVEVIARQHVEAMADGAHQPSSQP